MVYSPNLIVIVPGAIGCSEGGHGKGISIVGEVIAPEALRRIASGNQQPV
jgi:hypothetical protein